jgi:hypothetical protein
LETYQVQRRDDGAVVVRVKSQASDKQPALPDAVFCFRLGDPQYDYWSRKLGANGSQATVVENRAS